MRGWKSFFFLLRRWFEWGSPALYWRDVLFAWRFFSSLTGYQKRGVGASSRVVALQLTNKWTVTWARFIKGESDEDARKKTKLQNEKWTERGRVMETRGELEKDNIKRHSECINGSIAMASRSEEESGPKMPGDLVCKFSGCIAVGSCRDLPRINGPARHERKKRREGIALEGGPLVVALLYFSLGPFSRCWKPRFPNKRTDLVRTCIQQTKQESSPRLSPAAPLPPFHSFPSGRFLHTQTPLWLFESDYLVVSVWSNSRSQYWTFKATPSIAQTKCEENYPPASLCHLRYAIAEKVTLRELRAKQI